MKIYSWFAGMVYLLKNQLSKNCHEIVEIAQCKCMSIGKQKTQQTFEGEAVRDMICTLKEKKLRTEDTRGSQRKIFITS